MFTINIDNIGFIVVLANNIQPISHVMLTTDINSFQPVTMKQLTPQKKLVLGSSDEKPLYQESSHMFVWVDTAIVLIHRLFTFIVDIYKYVWKNWVPASSDEGLW